jgi:hypothetical protein
MAYQTPYSDAYLNTRAIANYNNPMFDVLRKGLGWLENQEQKIADRKKFELLKQIQDDAMTDRYTQARNANEDLAKQLYGNSYFVDSSDADLAKAMEALKIKESNKMLDTLGRDITSKVNQDVYKAGNEQELLSSLGFNNRTQDELNKVKDFAQQQLKRRYEPYIQGKLADREVLEGKINEDDIDSIVNSFKEKYGMDVNPALYYDSEKRKNQRKSALNSKLQQITSQLYGNQISPEQAMDQYRLFSLTNSDFADGINSQIQSVQSYADKQYEQEVANMISSAREDFRDELGNINYRALARAVYDNGLSMGIPANILDKVLNATFSSQGNDETSSKISRRLAAAKQRKFDFDNENGYIFGEPSPALAKAISEGDFYQNASDAFAELIGTPDFSSLGLRDSDLKYLLNFVHRQYPNMTNVDKKILKEYIKKSLTEFSNKKTEKDKTNHEVIYLTALLDGLDQFGGKY